MSTRTSAPRRSALPLALFAVALGCSDTSDAPQRGSPAGCPSGSIVGLDGSCIPVGIQGCADVFLEDGLCHPKMEKCPAGTIPELDEGCVPVGIQGCADTFIEDDGLCHPSMAKCRPGTIPELDEGCVPVGIQGCAEVFRKKDGLCHPTMAACTEPGTFAVPQQGCVPIDGPDGCGSGTWGNIAEDPNVQTIWVDPSVLVSGTGSKTSPKKTIAGALAVVPDGGRIALGTGSYDEFIHITKSVTIEGRCPSMVRVQGTGFAGSVVFVVYVEGADHVTLRGLELGGAGIGILATDAAGLTIDRVHVRNATTSGLVFAGSATEVSITKGWIDGTLAGNEGAGYGMAVVDGARAALAESAIVESVALGVSAGDAGTAVTLADSLVEGTLPQQGTGQFGNGIQAIFGAKVTLAESALVRNHSSGVAAFHAGTKLALTNGLVEGTWPSGTGQYGSGVNVGGGVGLTLHGTVVLDNHAAGVVAAGSEAEATVRRSLVQGTAPQPSDGMGGIGVLVVDGAKLSLDDSAIVENDFVGLVVYDAGTEVAATGTLVAGHGERGIAAEYGPIVTLDRSAVVENRYAGIAAHDAGTDVTATGCLVAGTLSTADQGKFGRGVVVSGGAHAVLEGSAIVGNRDSGLSLQDPGTEVTATGNLIAGTLPRESDAMFGRGAAAQWGAHLVLDANAIFENHGVGVFAGGDGTVLTAMGNLVQSTFPELSDGRAGRGVEIGERARATLEGNAIVDNRDVGLAVLGASFATVTSNLVEGTLPRESDGLGGMGVVTSSMSTLQLASSILRDNRVAALQVAGAAATVSRSLIDGVQAGSFALNDPPMTFSDVGDGLLATRGATLDITDTRVQGCVRAGLLFDDSTGTLSGVVSTDNQFGLVLQGDRGPDYQSAHNELSGNEVQDIVTGGDLPVPDEPSPVPPAP